MLRRKTMKLSALFEKAGITGENKDVEISFITDDSRKCRPGSLFVCHSGGEKYLDDAFKNGAQCAVSQNELPGCVRLRTQGKPTALFAAHSSAFRKESCVSSA